MWGCEFGGQKTERLRVIDCEQPANNDFLLVSQFGVTGALHTCRPDLVGYNFLAVEAIPLFPLVPDRWANQPGFDYAAEGQSFRWPLWRAPLSLDSIRSLLTLPLADPDCWPE